MSAWVMFIVGCSLVGQGAYRLSGRQRAEYLVDPLRMGWAGLLSGAGFAADGLPRIAGWSDAVSLGFAGAGFALIITGSILGLVETRAARRRRQIAGL